MTGPDAEYSKYHASFAQSSFKRLHGSLLREAKRAKKWIADADLGLRYGTAHQDKLPGLWC